MSSDAKQAPGAGGVEKDAATRQNPVGFDDERGDPAPVEIAPARAGVTGKAIMSRPPRAPPDVQAGAARIEAADILPQRCIIREPGPGRMVLTTRYLDRIGEGRTYDSVEMDSSETIKQAVMAGLGVAINAQHPVTEPLRAGRLVVLRGPDLPILRQWSLLHRDNLALRGVCCACAISSATRMAGSCHRSDGRGAPRGSIFARLKPAVAQRLAWVWPCWRCVARPLSHFGGQARL